MASLIDQYLPHDARAHYEEDARSRHGTDALHNLRINFKNFSLSMSEGTSITCNI